MKKLAIACIQLSPVVISSLLISAHFLRHGWIFMTIIGFIPLAALLIRHPISVRIAQGVLLFSTGVWIWTLVFLMRQRISLGIPYTKLVVILGSVAVFTFASIFVFKFKTLRDFYKFQSGG